MTQQELWSLLNLYHSVFSGEQIDEAIGIILNGGVGGAVEQAEAAAKAAAASATAAAGSAAKLESAVTNTTTAANLASDNAKLAESWAVGGTGVRDGEDVDNAKYYAQQAHEAAGGGILSINGQKPDETGNFVLTAPTVVDGVLYLGAGL